MENRKSIAILTGWRLKKDGNACYITNAHYNYMKFASQNFENVYLIASCAASSPQCTKLLDFPNLHIVEIPVFGSYLGAMKNYKAYCRAIESVINKVDWFYCRVPDPYCWLPCLKYKKKCLMHYVGDTIDATKNNVKWSALRKAIMIAGYYPEYLMTLRASRRSDTYTNGIHLRDKLARKGISATAVVSSTVPTADMKDLKSLKLGHPLTLFYIGYVRYAKGFNMLMDLWLKLKEKYPDFIFHVIGYGEMFEDVESFTTEHGLVENVLLHGHMDDRDRINELMHESQLFVFPSLSEGSPRVVIEAMSQGLPVVSTPVGSLPGTFSDGDTIRYFDFNDSDKAMEIIDEFVADPKAFDKMRHRAFEYVKQHFTIEAFLSQVYFPKA